MRDCGRRGRCAGGGDGDYIVYRGAALAPCASGGKAAGERARAAASAAGRLTSQSRAMKRQALMPSDWGEASHTTGVPMISGSSRKGGRGLPGGKKPGVSVGPPGTTMFTVTPVPSRALAKLTQLAPGAAWDAPQADNPPASMVLKLVVTVMMRPQPRLIMGSAANRAIRNAPTALIATMRCQPSASASKNLMRASLCAAAVDMLMP